MHITKVELENVKSHQHATFEFQRGTTAIMGGNGAGKTTIIEAVAWTLFDLLDYKKDDFVRRGSKNKGIARVTFQSGLDEREYTVYRDTGTGYYVYDPQLKIRIAEKKEEVTRFLRQHLGVEAGTDLEALFRRAIGVPQGTFTAIFLESATERKKAFDKLLKVEEYRQGAEKLRETVSFVRNKVAEVSVKIARAEGELARFEIVETEQKTIAGQIENLTAEQEKLNREATEKRENVKSFDEIEARVSESKTKRDKFQSETNTAEVVLRQKESDKNQAQTASEKLETIRVDYEIYVGAVTELKNLESSRNERDRLQKQISKIEAEIVGTRTERKGCGDNLQKALDAKAKIVELQPQVVEQDLLEKQRETLRNELSEAKAAERQIEVYENKLKNLRTRLGDIIQKIKDTEAVGTNVTESLADLEKRDTEVTNEIARRRAALERDAEFEREVLENLIKNHFCPITSQKCLNLETGKVSEKQIVGRTGADGQAQIAVLETERGTLTTKLKQAREAEKVSAALPTLYQLRSEVTEEGKSLREEQDNWKKRAADAGKIQSDLVEIETKLKVLGEPRARVKAYEIEAGRETSLREKIEQIEKNLARCENEKKDLTDALAKFAMLDTEWQKLSGERERTAKAYSEYLANEAIAKSLPERETQYENAKQKLSSLQVELEKAVADYENASKSYDAQRHLSEKAALLDAEKRLAETGATLNAAQKREAELSRELQRLKIVRLSMQEEFIEKERLQKILETTDFIRETLKEAAPRVARNYVYHVSLEANQMFREITGNAERSLKWTEDYGIMLEENGYERPFINLSGGEQMAAALSVRLALLKQLSDVRLAFFDEPTTNMDAARRERLAEQISHITERKTFDQLFVISHDDTFEGYVDNVVSIGNNES